MEHQNSGIIRLEMGPLGSWTVIQLQNSINLLLGHLFLKVKPNQLPERNYSLFIAGIFNFWVNSKIFHLKK